MKLFKLIEDLTKEELSFSETTNRRETIVNVATKAGKAVFAAAIPAGILASLKANGQVLHRTGDAVLDTLQFALTLEYLESTFYDTAFNTTGFSALMTSDQPVFAQIRKHEDAHVALLVGAITATYGAGNVPTRPAANTYDWTANGQIADPFATLNYQNFLALSQAFEDTGVRAYKGSAVSLMGSPVLTTALQIHSVEARHASEVRRIRGQKGWITQSTTDITIAQANYGAGSPATGTGPSTYFPAENNTVQAGIDVSAGTFASLGVTSDAATESFDEPLDKTTVVTLVTPFLS